MVLVCEVLSVFCDPFFVLGLDSLYFFLAHLLTAALTILHKPFQFNLKQPHLLPELFLLLLDLLCQTLIDGHLDFVVAAEECHIRPCLLQF